MDHDPADIDPDLRDRNDLVDDLLSNRNEDRMRTAGRHLVERLRSWERNSGRWRSLERASEDAVHFRHQLAGLAVVQFEPLLVSLEYHEPPSKSFAANECRRLLRRANDSGNKADWKLLREHLAWLADRLSAELDGSTLTKDRGVIDGVRYEVARAWNVVRRMDLAQIFADSAPRVNDAAFAASDLPQTSVAQILTTLSVNIGAGLTSELVQARREARTEGHFKQMADIIDSTAFQPRKSATLRSQLIALDAGVPSLIEAVMRDPAAELDESAKRQVAAAREWQSYISAELASAWGYVAVFMPDAVDALRVMGIRLSELEQCSRNFERSIKALDEVGARQAVGEMLEFQEDVASRLHSLVEGLRLHLPPPSIRFEMI